MRGFEQMMMDFSEDPELADTILDIPYRYHLEAAKHLVDLGVDMIWTGDDVGTQTGLLISPGTWRRFFKPRMAEFISTLKQMNPHLKVAYHSDGNIERIIPELIEIGVRRAESDPAGLHGPCAIETACYGDRLCFWGTIDEQRTLPFGTPDQVALGKCGSACGRWAMKEA